MIRLKFTFKLEYEIADGAADRDLDSYGHEGRQPDRELGFIPAFFDFQTFTIHCSRFADGALAAKARLIPGFVRGGFFYTRSAAARAAREWDCHCFR